MCWPCCSSSPCSCRGPSSRPPTMWPLKLASTCAVPYRYGVSGNPALHSPLLLVHVDVTVVVVSPDKNLQQDHAPVHLQHVYGRVNCCSDLQPGRHRYQPAHVVLLPLSQPMGHASASKKCLSTLLLSRIYN